MQMEAPFEVNFPSDLNKRLLRKELVKKRKSESVEIDILNEQMLHLLTNIIA